VAEIFWFQRINDSFDQAMILTLAILDFIVGVSIPPVLLTSYFRGIICERTCISNRDFGKDAEKELKEQTHFKDVPMAETPGLQTPPSDNICDCECRSLLSCHSWNVIGWLCGWSAYSAICAINLWFLYTSDFARTIWNTQDAYLIFMTDPVRIGHVLSIPSSFGVIFYYWCCCNPSHQYEGVLEDDDEDEETPSPTKTDTPSKESKN
jgi:hypothetical protein